MIILLYLFIQFLGIPLKVLSAILYPIVFLFKHKVLSYMTQRIEENDEKRVFIVKNGYKKWKLYLHPYFWMFCFTTGLTDQWHGPRWFMKEQKGKLMYDAYFRHPSTIISNLLYFWICYRWQAICNSHWAFMEWFFREGKWKDSTVKVEYCDPPIGSIYKYWDIMPHLKWDEGYDHGTVLRWETDNTPVEEVWLCTHLGQKKITFTTNKGNKRFMYAFVKIIYLRPLKLKLIIEHQFGWNWWNGMAILHFKHILRKP